MLICLSMDKWVPRDHFYSDVDPVRSLYNIRPCCYVIAQVVFWVELLVQRRLCPIFVKSRVPEKGDSMVWCRVTRHPQTFRELTGYQRTLGFGESQLLQVLTIFLYIVLNLKFDSDPHESYRT